MSHESVESIVTIKKTIARALTGLRDHCLKMGKVLPMRGEGKRSGCEDLAKIGTRILEMQDHLHKELAFCSDLSINFSTTFLGITIKPYRSF